MVIFFLSAFYLALIVKISDTLIMAM